MADSFSTALSSGVSAAMDALDGRPKGNDGSKIAGAAKEFEALLLGQILKSAHAEGGWLGTDDDDAGEAAVGLGEEQLARVMAASGGLGLSKLIESGVRTEQAAADAASEAAVSNEKPSLSGARIAGKRPGQATDRIN
jgi:Rod binding domain-containing protein